MIGVDGVSGVGGVGGQGRRPGRHTFGVVQCFMVKLHSTTNLGRHRLDTVLIRSYGEAAVGGVGGVVDVQLRHAHVAVVLHLVRRTQVDLGL